MAGAGFDQQFWDNGRRLVEELDSDDDTDTQGVGLDAVGNKRFASDPLRFTGTDLSRGGDMVRSRKKHSYGQEGDDSSDDDSDQDTEIDSDNQAQLALREKEEALAESAMRRIRRAQAKGKQEVKLNKKELAALESRRKRLQAEASNEKKKKKKEQRYAVPISQLAPVSHKERRNSRFLDDGLPQHPSPVTFDRTQGPPVGYFAPPQASSSRSSLGTSASRRPPSRTSNNSSPFQYSYVQPTGTPPTARHTSDPAARPVSSRGPLPREHAWAPPYNPSSASASAPSVPGTLDPFQYMTGGARAPYHQGTATSSPRNVSGSSVGSGYVDPFRAGPSAAAGKRTPRRVSPDVDYTEDSTSEEEDSDEEATSDELDEGVHVGSSNVGPSDHDEVIVVEREPPPETRSKKSSAASPSKRKPIGGTGGGRKKKGR